MKNPFIGNGLEIAKLITAILLVLAGIIIGCYVGFYVCFYGGIVDVIEQIRADVMVTKTLAFGIVKILFASPIGCLSGLVFILPARILAR